MKKLILFLATTVAVTVIANDERKEKSDQPRRGDAQSFRLPPKKEGESDEARKKRLLELLKKRRGEAAEAGARRGTSRGGEESHGRGRPARESAAPPARRGHGHDDDARREHARNNDGRHAGDHDARRRNQFEELERRIVAAKRAGKHEEAEKLMHQLNKMREHKARDEHANHNNRERAEHAERARHERAEIAEHARRQHPERGRHPEALNVEEAERRMIHLREAAELLGAVGKRDEAEKLTHEAHSIQQKLEQHHRARGHQGGPSNAQLAAAVEQMQKQIHELHQAIIEIRKHLNQKH